MTMFAYGLNHIILYWLAALMIGIANLGG